MPEPKNFDKILGEEARLSTAFGAGVGFPDFLTSEDFKTAVRDLNTVSPTDQGAQAGRADANARAVAASTQLLEWSFFDALRAEFGTFKLWFLSGVVLIAAGLTLFVISINLVAAAITQPTAALVRLSSSGVTDFSRTTNCASSTTKFVAVSGTCSCWCLRLKGPAVASTSNLAVSRPGPSPSGVAGPSNVSWIREHFTC